jgi:hypothetical protein
MPMSKKRKYKRRGPRLPQDPDGKGKSRKPRGETLTLKKLQELISDPIPLWPSEEEDQRRREIVEQCRDDIRKGDLWALFRAVDTFFTRLLPGVGYVDARDPEKKRRTTIEVPAWLLGEILLLLYRGLSGDWPKLAHGRGSPMRKHLDAYRDLWYVWQVLKARDGDMTLEAAFEHVADNVKGKESAVSSHTVSMAYRRVRRHLREDPGYYRKLGGMRPRLLEAAVGPPYRY